MDITGKINLFVKRLQNGNNVFSTTISKKREEGGYVSKYIDVIFSKDIATKEQLNAFEEKYCYQVEIKKGFITCNEYEDKNGNMVSKFVICITEAKSDGKKEVTKKTNQNTDGDLPF